MPGKKIVDETYHVSRKRGNGLLRREIWVDPRGKVVRYNLAYINHALCALDNGRVVGYDNAHAHGYHHRHCMGEVEPVEFTCFEEIETRFERDWLSIGAEA